MSTLVGARFTLAAFIITAFLSIPPTAAGGPAKLLPVDEATRDKALSAYRTRLLILVANRDADGLAASISPVIKLSFGGMQGRDHLRSLLTGDASQQTWANLQQILKNGGRFIADGSFAAPYWSEADYGPDADPFFTYTVTGRNIPVFAKPDPSAARVFNATHDIVTSIGDDGHSTLVHIRFADGREGFIARANIASPVGYRARFQKTTTGWRLITFLAGD